jgi:hypothetical protein
MGDPVKGVRLVGGTPAPLYFSVRASVRCTSVRMSSVSDQPPPLGTYCLQHATFGTHLCLILPTEEPVSSEQRVKKRYIIYIHLEVLHLFYHVLIDKKRLSYFGEPLVRPFSLKVTCSLRYCLTSVHFQDSQSGGILVAWQVQ